MLTINSTVVNLQALLAILNSAQVKLLMCVHTDERQAC